MRLLKFLSKSSYGSTSFFTNPLVVALPASMAYPGRKEGLAIRMPPTTTSSLCQLMPQGTTPIKLTGLSKSGVQRRSFHLLMRTYFGVKRRICWDILANQYRCPLRLLVSQFMSAGPILLPPVLLQSCSPKVRSATPTRSDYDSQQ